ncbi:MAG TPA: hypothetical protein VN456_08075, partial [Desulfosporosinus sp.]|nr:hypothetical protein [Desulfosporosinus sp.]
MIMVTFVVYFIIFMLIYSGPKFRKKENLQVSKLIAIPALLAIVMVLLTLIKVYFIYKIMILIFVLVMTLLS